ncbi:MAG: 16S rRNA (cytosine(1402)-N(4))-methyltransferase RsmH [Erysipelotrichaceae bacterium]|nr:16S rRNA (cytosine(1402)-N(4))-methyltransferase RsmH [Erysipelotrichaceae bacterium]
MNHYSVMLKQSIDALEIKPDGIYIDGTLGRGGHSREILKRFDKGHLYTFDLDSQAIEESKENLAEYLDKVTFIHDNYKNFDLYVDKADGILLDLGVSSPQFDQEERGFSYRFDSRLDMRMDESQDLDACKVVNEYSEKELSRIFEEYGECRFARKVAARIVERRQEKAIETTFELIEIIKSCLPERELNKKGHPAKQYFQALRIAVNHELDSLEEFLNKIDKHLNVKGTVVIISFHSLEDRIIKNRFRELCTDKDDKNLILKQDEIEKADFEYINRKPLIADEKEISENSRSKSAKLRAVRKVK